MVLIDDGYIIGVLRPSLGKCPLCLTTRQRVIDVGQVHMPTGFGVEATILWNHKVPMGERYQHNAIGLTCGCYAKFHRQVAHICGSRMRSGATV